ncbi:MAG: hypothetical protein ACT4QE_05555 [Anaerolineales bacterium]
MTTDEGRKQTGRDLLSSFVHRPSSFVIPMLNTLTPLDNFGHSIRSAAYLYRPTHVEQIAELFRTAERHGLTIALRGAGRSYAMPPSTLGRSFLTCNV